MKPNNSKLESSLKIIARTAFLVFIAIVLSKILTYAYRIIIARHYGPEYYGLFSLAIAISGWFIIFSKFGLTGGLLRYISLYRGQNKPNKIKYLFKIALIILLFTGLVSAIVLFFLAEFISVSIFNNPELIIFLKLFAILIPLDIFLVSFLAAMVAFEKVGTRSFIFYVLTNIVRVGALLIFIWLGLRANAIIFSYLLGTAISLIAAYYVCAFIIKGLFGKHNLSKKEKSQTLKEVFSYSWPLLFFGVVSSLFHWTDTFVLGFFKTATDVGFYNAAINIAMFLSLTPQLFASLYFSSMTKEYAKNNISLVREVSKQIGKWIFIINLPLMLLMMIFPGAFINILFGSQYLAATKALQFLAIGFLFNSVFKISNDALSISGRSKTILADILLAALVNLILNVWLVPLYGINGAAIATTVSLILLNMLFLFQATFYLSITQLKRKMLGIFIIALTSTIILVFLNDFVAPTILNILSLGLTFVLLYIVLTIITSSLDKNDINIIISIANKIKRRK